MTTTSIHCFQILCDRKTEEDLSVLGCDTVSSPHDSNPQKHSCQNCKFHRTIAISPEDGVIIPKHAVSINK